MERKDQTVLRLTPEVILNGARVSFDKIERGQRNSVKQHPHQRDADSTNFPSRMAELPEELFRHPQGWTVQSSSHQSELQSRLLGRFRLSPRQGGTQPRGLKRAEIFMPHPEDQASETELMPAERWSGILRRLRK